MKTQTDKEVATQEQDTWQQKKLAEVARAESVKASTEADREADKVDAKVRIEISRDMAQAEIEAATGNAESARMQIEAMGGFENFVALKVAEMLSEQWQGKIPEVLVIGGDGKLDSAVMSKILQSQSKKEGSKEGSKEVSRTFK